MAKRVPIAVKRKWPCPTLVIEENNATRGHESLAHLLNIFKLKAARYDGLMASAVRAGDQCAFRALTQISSGYHRAARILEKELKKR